MKKSFLYLSTAIIFATNAMASSLTGDGLELDQTITRFNTMLPGVTSEEFEAIKDSNPVGATLQDPNASTAIARIYGTTGALIFDDQVTQTLIKMGYGAQISGQGMGFDLVYFNQDVSSSFTGTSFSNGSTASANITIVLNGITYGYTATGSAIPAGSMITFRAIASGTGSSAIAADSSKIFSLRTVSGIASASTGILQATSIVSALNTFLPNGATIRGSSKNISSAYDSSMNAMGISAQTNVAGIFSSGMFANPMLSSSTLPTTFTGSSFTVSGQAINVTIGTDTFTYTVPNGSSSSALNPGSLLVFNNALNTKTFSVVASSQIAINSSDISRANEICTGLNDYFQNGSNISSSYQLPNNNQILAMLGATEVDATSGSVFNNIFLNALGSTQTFTGSSFAAASGVITVSIGGSSYTYTESLTGQTPIGAKIVFAGPNGASLTLQTASVIGTTSDTSTAKAAAISTALNTFFPNSSQIFGNEINAYDAIMSTASLIMQNPVIGNGNSLYDLTNSELNKLISQSDALTHVSQSLSGSNYSNPILNQSTSTQTTFGYNSFSLSGTTISTTIDGSVYTYTPTSATLSAGSVVFTGPSGKTMTITLANSYSEPATTMLALQMTLDLNNAFNGVIIYKNPLTIDNAIDSINAIIGGGQTVITDASGSDFSNVDCNFDLGSAGVTFTSSSFANSSADITVTIGGVSLTYTTTATDEIASGEVIAFEGADGEVLEVTTGAALGTTGNTAIQNAAAITSALNTYFAPATLMSGAEFIDQTSGGKFTSAAINAINGATTTYDKMQAFLELFNAISSSQAVTFTKPTGNITTLAGLIACFD